MHFSALRLLKFRKYQGKHWSICGIRKNKLVCYIFALEKSGKWALWQKNRRQPNPLFRRWRMCCKNTKTSRMFLL